MGYPEVLTFALVLVYSVESYPRARSSMPGGMMSNSTLQRGIVESQESKSVKFPNALSAPTNPSDIVRTPTGEWARDRRPVFSHNHSRATGGLTSEGIVFPDDSSPTQIPSKLPTKENMSNKFVPRVGKLPSCAKGSTFCESIDDYPISHLDAILENSALEFRTLFGDDVVKDEGGIIHRIDGVVEDTLCASSERVVYPKTAKNKDDQWLFVVNQGQYTQGVRIEVCLNGEGSSVQRCSFTDGFPLGYQPFCKQKYIYRKLLAINSDGEPVTDTFQLPSCCSCAVKSESLHSRSGSPSNRQSPPVLRSQKTNPTSNSTKN